LLESAMDVLNEREREILTRRRMLDRPATLDELSGRFDVSRERIRQIEVLSFEKLRERVRELADERGLSADS